MARTTGPENAGIGAEGGGWTVGMDRRGKEMIGGKREEAVTAGGEYYGEGVENERERTWQWFMEGDDGRGSGRERGREGCHLERECAFDSRVGVL